MNLEQAKLQVEQLNTILGESAQVYKYFYFAYWGFEYTKYYNTVLLPTQYSDIFTEADYSIQLAFARVGIKTAVQEYKDPETFVNLYNQEVLNDQELYDYIYKSENEI
jgi:hypothetical protein